MSQGYSLARGSISLELADDYAAAFASLTPAERATFEEAFTVALHGGDHERRIELFDVLHESGFCAKVHVDDEGQVSTDELRAVANAVIECYGAESPEFDLSFDPLGNEAQPSGDSWSWDSEAEVWIRTSRFRLTVATGNVAGKRFNWLPLSEAMDESGFKLPTDLRFMLNGSTPRLDAHYVATVEVQVQ
ncbi:MAG: hypothetical protein AAFZ65_07590 [Planctomycetota bacterium]